MIDFIDKRVAYVTAALANPLSSLLGLVFFVQVATGMVWSVIAVYAESMGAGAAMVGFLISTFGGARLLVSFPSGMASEKFGRRFMMRLGCGFTAVSAFLGATTSGIPALYACLLMMGLGSAIYVTSALAAIIDLGSPDRRVREMSIYQAANIIGISLGPGLGGMVAGLWGYHGPFLFQGVVALCALWLAPANCASADVNKAPAVSWSGMIGLIKEPQAISIGMMAFATTFVRISSNWVILPLIATTKFRMNLGTIGIILTCGAMANLACLPFTTWLAQRLGRTRLIVLSSIVTMTGALVLGFGDMKGLMWIASMCFGVGSGIAAPVLMTYIADTALPNQRGPALGLLRTMLDAGMILGPSVTGLLAEHLGLGYRGGLLGSIAILAIATLIFIKVAPARKVG